MLFDGHVSWRSARKRRLWRQGYITPYIHLYALLTTIVILPPTALDKLSMHSTGYVADGSSFEHFLSHVV